MGGIYWDLELEKRIKDTDSKHLERYGYKIYSQNDEDGIIHEIFRRIGTNTKTFVEFGVDKGLECNTHALLLQGWKGIWIEGRESAVNQINRRFSPAIRDCSLKVVNAFITRDNINSLIGNSPIRDLDLLSIDVDGNDWHIWDAIDCVFPRVVVIEYNGKLAPEIDWVMPYNDEHSWDRSDRFGASLKALEKLGKKKGYHLVGTNICGINAFFVRDDLAGDLFANPPLAENLYNPARMNMSPYQNGHPAKNYIGSNREGIEGVFGYYPDWTYYPAFGFYNPAVVDDDVLCTMREKEARIYVRNIPADCNEIIIRYSCMKEVVDARDINVFLSMDENKQAYGIQDAKGDISIKIPSGYYSGQIVPIDIEIGSMWIPNRLNGNGDMRLQGITIVGIKYVL